MITILGSGAVGALLAARLGDDVRLVTTERSAEAISRDGITLASADFSGVVAVEAVTAADVTGDVLVVATKAPHLGSALERVSGTPAAVVPLLNGVDHMAVLRERFPVVIAATVRVQAHREGLTRVVHRTPLLAISIADPGVPELEDRLARAGVEVERGGSDADVLWAKFSRLAGIALATTAANAPLGDVRDDAEAIAGEAVTVADAEGAAIESDAVIAGLRALPDAATSSLRADVHGGSADHEIDAIGGALLRAADRHGLDVPNMRAAVERIGGVPQKQR
jgi:2-dehydropantoate 2-reductase